MHRPNRCLLALCAAAIAGGFLTLAPPLLAQTASPELSGRSGPSPGSAFTARRWASNLASHAQAIGRQLCAGRVRCRSDRFLRNLSSIARNCAPISAASRPTSYGRPRTRFQSYLTPAAAMTEQKRFRPRSVLAMTGQVWMWTRRWIRYKKPLMQTPALFILYCR